MCNDIIVVNNRKTGKVEYFGQSSDELALLKMAEQVGYRIKQKTMEFVVVEFGEQYQKKFWILDRFEFSSERKRMSILVRDGENQ